MDMQRLDLFLRLTRIILGLNAPILSKQGSNTDAKQAIRCGQFTGVKPSNAFNIFTSLDSIIKATFSL